MHSPAARNRIAPPGPGANDYHDKDMALTREKAARPVFSKSERFKKSPPYLPGVDTGAPGPGAYEVAERLSLGQYKVGKTRQTPRWTLRRKIPLELAKVTC